MKITELVERVETTLLTWKLLGVSVCWWIFIIGIVAALALAIDYHS